MSTKRMVFTAEKESFIVRVLIKKVQDSGINCDFVPFRVNELHEALADAPLVAIYMEDDVLPKDDVLHYIIDLLEEKGGKIVFIGTREDIKIVCEHMPMDIVYKTYARPVDNAVFVDDVKEYYDKMESGELKKSILIVDDDPQYLMLIRSWLQSSYKVSMANSGLQAIKLLGKNKVDLILLDHEMPVTSGPRVLEMLRSDEETRSIPVMFLTGKSDKESVMAVVALHPEGYFLKTIQRDELLKELKAFFILHDVK